MTVRFLSASRTSDPHGDVFIPPLLIDSAKPRKNERGADLSEVCTTPKAPRFLAARARANLITRFGKTNERTWTSGRNHCYLYFIQLNADWHDLPESESLPRSVWSKKNDYHSAPDLVELGICSECSFVFIFRLIHF